MPGDPFAEFKATQREGWALFAPLEAITTIPAAKLVSFAKVARGETVLDVGSGTGVVAVTAARLGAKAKALDLSPVLLEVARKNAATAKVELELAEGDVERLPYADAVFDVVLSQFGHMFAPRPEVAVSEMLRVLRPGGRIAFSTWPPEHFVGRLFTLVSSYMGPPADPAPAPPPQWGDVSVVRARLGDKVKDLVFDRDVMAYPALSPQHYRVTAEASIGPVIKLVATLTPDPPRLARFRSELETLVSEWTEDNTVRQHFLMSRATKV